MKVSDIALSPSVLEAWDEIVRRSQANIPAERAGSGNDLRSNSVKDFSRRLFPIRELLRDAAEPLLASIPTYQDIQLRFGQLHRKSQKGALLRGYFWIHASKTRELTSGKLQMTFCPEGIVRSEYVCYPSTQSTRKYHIQNVTRWFRDPEWFSQFRKGCSRLRMGFALMCKTADGKRIDDLVSDISDADWKLLRQEGLDTNEYFVIHFDRHRDDLLHLTIEELAQLFVADFADLAPLYPLLQGSAPRLGEVQLTQVTSSVRGTIRTTTPLPRRIFRPEFAGERRRYTINNPIQSRSLHGPVVEALSNLFASKNIPAFNSQLMDLYVLDNDDRMTALFEAKTDTTTSSIYEAVGQLMLHGAAQEDPPIRVIIIPQDPVPRTAEALRKLGIRVATYRWNAEVIEFSGLDEVIELMAT